MSVADELLATVRRIPLFLLSYTPLFVIVAIRFHKDRPIMGGALVLTILASISLLWFFYSMRKSTAVRVIVSDVREVGAEAGGYLATYVLPLATLSQPSPADLVGYAIFLLVLAIVYVRTDLMQVNPIFYLLLWRIVRVTSTGGATFYLATRVAPKTNDWITVSQYAGIKVLRNKGEVDAS
ncbi:Uncharacterised protein [Mycobacteroides abscessus subsp. bolletii]|nr:Uncharacterised protein [Mycobacteroides abscessus subsp. bolletii]SKX01874.1 Uncharacterised protein [Mycobacteroides abscessus subsp. bolletii]